VVDEECVAGPREDGDRDAVAVVLTQRKNTENQEVEGSLEEGVAAAASALGGILPL
jgi:hypothetical protein